MSCRIFVTSVLALALVVPSGCRRSGSPDADEPAPPPQSGDAAAVVQEEAGAASTGPSTSTGGVPAEVLAKVCAGPCAGPFARMNAWRDAAGALVRIVMHGDLQSCSHPPTTYWDANGRLTEQIGLEPVVPGSPEQLAFAERRDRQLEGLTEAESLSCPGTPPAP